MDEFLDDEGPKPAGSSARPLLMLAGGLVVLGLVAGGAYSLLRPSAGEADEKVKRDPLLSKGRELYLQRCNSCHGNLGRGDGPIAKSLSGPPPGDLTDGKWKHGDRPDQVVGVIGKGIPGTSMAAWAVAFSEPEIRALAAYVYHLEGKDVPRELREESVRP